VKRTTIKAGAALSLALAITVGAATSTRADQPIDTSALRTAVTAGGVTEHLQAFQAIANANDGTRAAGTPGYEASVNYVREKLLAAGYTVTTQPFSYDIGIVDSATIEQTAPGADTYVYGTDFVEMQYTPDGTADADVTAVDVNLEGDRATTSGCEADDFADFPEGNIALIQRGFCFFRDKAQNAFAAGASAVIIFNQGNVDPSDDRFGLFGGTLDPDPQIGDMPVFSMPFELGAELAETEGLHLLIDLQTHTETINTWNVIADSPGGRSDRTVLAGAHLDSVPAGPGINDNGSGSATLLEIAEAMAGTTTTNHVRFAFWGGEEDGLIGSAHYVSQLSARDAKNIALNLNFDMVGSPNYVRFVYDGDGSAFGVKGPSGSALIEKVFTDYFAAQGLATEPTEFDGRSDYDAFINAGIPAGGLFTGAEGIKSAEQAAIYGGTAGVAFDPCYHAVCDTITNISQQALDQMSDAAAHAIQTFAMTSSAVNGTAKGKAVANGSADFRGSFALR
jgi:Zn-dependent M28 family amino/carboxypeptidase